MAVSITIEEIIGFLLEAPMFGDLDPAELSQVVRIMRIQRFSPGEWIFREGEPGDAWYVLYDGLVEVFKETPYGVRSICKLGQRACFGEMSILDGSSRSASIRSVSDATAFQFPRGEFEEMLHEPNLAAFKLVHQMALILAARQRETTARLADLLTRDRLADVLRGVEPIIGVQAITE